MFLCVQEAQRAAKAVNTGKQVAGQKQKEPSAMKEEAKKSLIAKIQTTGSHITKYDISATGKLLLPLSLTSLLFITIFFNFIGHKSKNIL